MRGAVLRRRLVRAGAMAGVCASVLACRAHAADTQWWTSNSQADHAKSESRGVLVDPDGVLRPGPAARAFDTDSLSVAWCAAMLKDGTIAVGGDGGRVLRWSERGGWRVWARLGGGQVLSLAADGDGAVAGTGPRGLVYRIAANGDTTRLAATGERYVWGLASAGRGAWFAATGTRGRIVRLAEGKASVVLDTQESNLVCLVADGKGGVLAGGDSRGRIYHVAADGTASTLFDAGEEEVRALAMSRDGVVWAAGLTLSAASDEGGGGPAGGPGGGPGGGEEGPVPVRGAVTGGRAVLYRITPEGDAVAWWTSPQPLVFALLVADDGVLAATGNRAGVFRVERANGATSLLAPPQGQVTALVAGTGGVRYAVTSNPVVLWRLGPGQAEGGELLAPVLDAKRFARFGRVRSVGAGARAFSTRSGNADTPDTTWSRWQPVGGDGAIASPPGRCLQWKVRLGSGDARVDEVTVSYRESNQPPRVDDLRVAPQGQGFKEGEMSQRSEAVTQTLSGGQKVEYSVSMGGAKSVHEMPIWARGLRTLSWRGVDPNGDPLRYTIAVRSDPDGPWIQIGKDLESSVLTWNTNTLSDGRYRVKVTASDAEGNAVGEALTGEAVSEPFSIDNTPPRVGSLEARPGANGVELTGAAEDGEGWLQRLDLAIDDGDWHSLSPEGGLSDSPRLTFRTVLKDLGPGPHLLSVRAVDAAGNAATRAAHVTVAARK
jgi:hypothetical protein